MLENSTKMSTGHDAKPSPEVLQLLSANANLRTRNMALEDIVKHFSQNPAVLIPEGSKVVINLLSKEIQGLTDRLLKVGDLFQEITDSREAEIERLEKCLGSQLTSPLDIKAILLEGRETESATKNRIAEYELSCLELQKKLIQKDKEICQLTLKIKELEKSLESHADTV